jgi:electron transfer flavoprotein beta subunit
VAEFLDIPHISMVVKQELVDGRIRCQRTVEGGTLVVEAPLPALFTTQRGLNEPRYTSLPGIMKAKRKPLETKTLADICLEPAALANCGVRIAAFRLPPQRSGGRMIAGDSAQAKAAELVRLLHEEAKVV